MRVFLLLLFVGFASATQHEALQEASDNVIESFLRGMDLASPLHEALGIEDNDIVSRLESDIKDELVEYMKNAFRRAIAKLEAAIENGKDINQEDLTTLKEIHDKMHEFDVEDHNSAVIKAQLSDLLRRILEKNGIFDKRSIDEPMQSVFEDLSFRNFFLKMKEMILNQMDVATLKLSIAKVLGQGSQSLCEWLTNKGKEKLTNFFDRMLENSEEQHRKRSVSHLYEQVKDYFRDLDIDVKQKFAKLEEWLHTVVEKGLDGTKSELEIVRRIAHEILNKSENVSKEVATEALEFLHKYRKELGDLYDQVRDKVVQKLLDYTD